MAVLAQNIGYYNSPENSLDTVDFTAISGFLDIAKQFQSGLSGTSGNPSSENNVNNFSFATTTQVESGFASDFNFKAYGAARDAEALKEKEGYASDADRERAAEEKQPNMAMGIDLDINEQLVNIHHIPIEDLAFAKSLGRTDKEMLTNHENGLAVDGGKLVESGMPLQVQRNIDAIQSEMAQQKVNYIDTEDRERAANVDNGIQASALGAKQMVTTATTI